MQVRKTASYFSNDRTTHSPNSPVAPTSTAIVQEGSRHDARPVAASPPSMIAFGSGEGCPRAPATAAHSIAKYASTNSGCGTPLMGGTSKGNSMRTGSRVRSSATTEQRRPVAALNCRLLPDRRACSSVRPRLDSKASTARPVHAHADEVTHSTKKRTSSNTALSLRSCHD